MGRGADVASGVVENEILELDELAVDLQRGAGVGEVLPLEEAGAGGRARNPLIETGDRNAGVESRLHQGTHADFREIVSH